MIKYKYQISGKTAEEIWVCEACRKGKSELILTGKWKLIDRSGDSGISCSLCEETRADTEAGSLLLKTQLDFENELPILKKENHQKYGRTG